MTEPGRISLWCAGKYGTGFVANLLENDSERTVKIGQQFVRVKNECIVAQFFDSLCTMSQGHGHQHALTTQGSRFDFTLHSVNSHYSAGSSRHGLCDANEVGRKNEQHRTMGASITDDRSPA